MIVVKDSHKDVLVMVKAVLYILRHAHNLKEHKRHVILCLDICLEIVKFSKLNNVIMLVQQLKMMHVKLKLVILLKMLQMKMDVHHF